MRKDLVDSPLALLLVMVVLWAFGPSTGFVVGELMAHHLAGAR